MPSGQFKTFWIILIVLNTILLTLPLQNIKAATSTADQSCDLSGGGGVALLGDGVYQTFTPSMNRLTKVRVNLSIEGLVAQDVSLSVYKGGTLIVNAGSQTVDAGWQSPVFSFTEKEMTPGDATYKIVVSASGISDWVFTAGSCYAGGEAYTGGAPNGTDYGFTTYGYNYTAPVEKPADTNGNPTSDNPPANPVPAEESPDQVGASTISSPKELLAEDVPSDEGGSIKLSWQASVTSDITGYKAFRSTEEKKGFKEIGEAPKGKTEFVDTQAEVDKIFYYYVRAYNGSEQSNSSNTASVTAKDNIAPKIPTKFKISSATEPEINFIWEKNTEADLSGYVLVVYNPKDQGNLPIETIEVPKEKINYKLVLAEHDRLRSNTAYDFSLQAKDTHNNLSSKTRLLSSSFGKAQTGPKVWYAVAAGVLVLAAAGVLIFLHYKKRKKGQEKLEGQK